MHVYQQVTQLQTHLPHARGKVGMGVLSINFIPTPIFTPALALPLQWGGDFSATD